MRISRISVGFGLLLLIVTVALAQKVTTDYKQGADFSKYKRFMWIKELSTKDPLMKQRMIEAINAQLTAKGLQLATGNADLAVAAHVATQEKQTLNTFYEGIGGWAWGLDGTATTVQTYEEGTMVVDLFDANTQQIVWRGSATSEIPGSTKKETKKVEKAIEKMFSNFPPK